VRSGPLQETAALLRAAFWPSRPRAIDAALASDEPLDDSFVSELGADVKGLHALEYLLFPAGLAPAAAVAHFEGGPGARRRSLCAAYARAVANHAGAGERALGAPAAFAERFASGEGESLAIVVGELITVLETLAVERLDLVVRLDLSRRLSPEAFEGGPSRTSHELAVAQFRTSEQLYRGRGGGGVADLVTARAPGVSERVEQRWDTAVASVGALTAPLEELVKRDRPRVVAAVSALKLLEIVLKVDVASALGLTLSFPGGDGD
jgi:predicted lipoprotein